MSLVSCIDKPTMAENLFGKSKDPNCQGDCKLVDRYLSIFPLRNENTDGKTKLTEFTYKTIMFTVDNLVIFDSEVQKEVSPFPNRAATGRTAKPKFSRKSSSTWSPCRTSKDFAKNTCVQWASTRNRSTKPSWYGLSYEAPLESDWQTGRRHRHLMFATRPGPTQPHPRRISLRKSTNSSFKN